MNLIEKIQTNKKEILIHIGFWLFYLLMRIFLVKMYYVPLSVLVYFELLELPLKMFSAYMIIYLLPYLLREKKYLNLLVTALIFVVFITLLRRMVDFYIIFPEIVRPEIYSKVKFWNIVQAFRQLIYILPASGTAASLYFIRGWYIKNEQNEQLKKEKLEAELNFLKAQIHPHFLFNTLNNLYALTLIQSPKSPGVVLKLSELLSYMLYECNTTYVPLKKELEQIKNYIELEKLRHGDKVDVSVNITGDREHNLIAPLLLISFLENSFKHGINKKTGKGWISLYLNIEEQLMTLKIENGLYENQGKKEIVKGIGIKNVKKRLAILYKNKYELNIVKDDSYFVVLKLDLKIDN